MKLNHRIRITALTVFCAAAMMPVATFAAKPHPHEARGTIKSMDAEAHTLVVSDLKGKSEHTFQWNTETRFTAHGQPATAADLKVGERIRLTYKAGGDRPVIEKARVAPATNPKPPAEKS